MNYEKVLDSKVILSDNVKKYIKEFQEGQLSITQFHNKRYYARQKGNILVVVELTIAYEIFQGVK